MSTIQCITPLDGSVYVERETAGAEQIQQTLSNSVKAQQAWRDRPVAERQALCSKAVDAFVARQDEIAAELCWQMGRPIAQGPGEVGGKSVL